MPCRKSRAEKYKRRGFSEAFSKQGCETCGGDWSMRASSFILRRYRKRCFRVERQMVVSRVGPVDKSKNSAETHSGPSRIVNLEIEKDGIYHPIKV